MKNYKIEIEEILQNVYDIEASSLEEAINIAQDRYYNEKYILEAENLKETNFREYQDKMMRDEKTKKKQMER